MTEPRSRQQFAEVVSRPGPGLDLGLASLLIACEEYPDLDVAAYLGRLEALGTSLRHRLEDLRPPAAVSALNRLLFEEERFRGNIEDYYDPRNSFLNDVLDRHTGIPITLSTLYIEVGRRAGIEVEGVSLPGHFIVRVSGPDGGLLVDPFSGGARLSEADCQQRLDRIYAGQLELQPQMLAACGPRDMLARLLGNLKAIYVKAEDYPRALNVVELRLRLDPRSAEDMRDRGLLHAALDCYRLAAEDLEAYLVLAPSAADAPKLKEKIADLRLRATRLN